MPSLISMRLSLSASMSAKNRYEDPGNSHTQIFDEKKWVLMQHIRSIPYIELVNLYREACGYERLSSNNDQNNNDDIKIPTSTSTSNSNS